MYLLNYTFCSQLHRLYTNAEETILAIISLYYYMDIKDKFDKNVIIVVALQTFSFVIRNTSPIGWIPILLIKVFYNRSLVPFIKALFLIA